METSRWTGTQETWQYHETRFSRFQAFIIWSGNNFNLILELVTNFLFRRFISIDLKLSIKQATVSVAWKPGFKAVPHSCYYCQTKETQHKQITKYHSKTFITSIVSHTTTDTLSQTFCSSFYFTFIIDFDLVHEYSNTGYLHAHVQKHASMWYLRGLWKNKKI